MPETPMDGKLTLSQTHSGFLIQGEQFQYVFNAHTGLPFSLSLQSKKWLHAPAQWNTWRAPTDNDAPFRSDWERFHLEHLVPRVYAIHGELENAHVRISADLSLTGPVYRPPISLKLCWLIHTNGLMELQADVTKQPECPPLPRFGIRLFLPSDFAHAEYLGFGPLESYPDKKEATWWGRFTETIDANREDHIRPQESGAHTGCSSLKVFCNDGRALQITADPSFGFSLSRYSQEAITNACHRHELRPEACSILCLDYAQAGIGSASCGPAPAPEYLLKDEQFKFHFAIQPLFRKENEV